MTEYLMGSAGGVHTRETVERFNMGLTRPVVVIDPENREQVERLVEAFAQAGVWKTIPADVEHMASYRADQMQAALREFAKPTPPKPEEPKGLGAVVEDAKGRRWLRDHFEGSTTWFWAEPQEGGDWERRGWADIDVPDEEHVLSWGVE